jgi:tetratricopeptide (TPR) repeat protein
MPLLTLSSAQASGNVRSNRLGHWPVRPHDQARLRGVPKVGFDPGFTLEPGEPIFTVGSCFARSIEARLHQLGFELPALGVKLDAEERNESGAANNILNKYTPFSILNEVRWALDPAAAFPEESFLDVGEGLWSDPQTAPQTRPAPIERLRERRRMIGGLYARLPQCRVVIMTLGLAESWFDLKTGLYLNGNPHRAALKREPDRFELHVLTVEEIGAALEQIHALLAAHGHPDVRILLTVSPVPLAATMRDIDVITANTYSKSALRAAAEGFVLAHENVDYLPSYEVVTHADRTVAFVDDCRHVARPVVADIVGGMIARYVPGAAPEDVAAAAPSGPGVEDARARLRTAMKHKEFDKAVRILAGLKDGAWAQAGFSEFEYRLEHGRVLMLAKKVLEAEAELSRACELDPESIPALIGLARARRMLGRRREAEDCLARAVELDPRDPQLRYLLAVDMARDRRQAQAVAHLKACLELKPDHAEARELLDKCSRRLAEGWRDADEELEAGEGDQPRGAGGIRSLMERITGRR